MQLLLLSLEPTLINFCRLSQGNYVPSLLECCESISTISSAPGSRPVINPTAFGLQESLNTEYRVVESDGETGLRNG